MSEHITTYARYAGIGGSYSLSLQKNIITMFGGRNTIPDDTSINTRFGMTITSFIKRECEHLYRMGYTPWIQEETPDDEFGSLTDTVRFDNYILRQIQLKYKYFDYFKDKWTLANLGGLTEKTVETLDRTIEKSGTVAKDTTTQKAHDSTTDNTYTVDSEIVDSGSMTSKSADENSPLGTSLVADITTPSMKTSGTQTDSNTSTTDRTDTTHLVVDSDDSMSESVEKTTTDTADDDYTKTIEFANGIEALKTLRYLDYSIVDVITEIVDSTCKELNEFL